MRIERFDLLRYGRFTDVSLDLSGPGVHLVVGPNEAGKSTMRNAMADLLYGIEHRTPYAYVHEMPSLRLGALLRAANGATQEIVRLKRNKEPLRGPDDETLEQAVLDRILVGVSREDFTRVFAIDHDELRAGGKRLLDVNGEVGQALFESQSSAHLSSLHAELVDRAKKLWVNGGRNPVLNAALLETGPYRAALRRRDEALLHPRDYKQAELAVAEAEKRRALIAEQLTRSKHERERLTRIQQCLPGMVIRNQLLEEKQELEAGSFVDAEITREYGRVRHTGDEIERELATHASAIARLEEEISELDPDLRLLDQSDLINELNEEASAAIKARTAAADDQDKARRLRREAAEALSLVSPGQDAASVVTPVSALVRARVDDHRDELVEAIAALAAAGKNLAKQQSKLAKEEAKLAAVPAATGTAALRAVLDAVPPALQERIQAGTKLHKDAAAALQKARKRHHRFELPEDIAERTIPSEEEVSGHRKTWEAADKAVAKQREKADELAGAHDRARDALDRFLATDPPPSDEDLARARGEREQLWSVLRPRLASDGQPELAAPLPVGEFEDAVDAADQTVDRIRREAQRQADRRSLEADLRQTTDRLASARQALDAAVEERSAIEGAWTTLWAPSGIPAPALDAARDLLAAIGKIRELTDRRDELSAELSADRTEADACAVRLREALAETGVVAPPNATLAELVAHATRQREALSKQATDREKAAAVARQLRGDVTDSAAEVAELEGALDERRGHWDRFLAEHGLSGEPDEVSATLAALDDAAQLNRDAAAAEKRAEAAAEQAAVFAKLLGEVLASCGRAPVQDANRHQSTVKALKQALDAETKDLRDFERLTKELATERGKHAKTLELRQKHVDALEMLLQRASVADEQELIEASQRTADLVELDKQLKVAEKGLTREGVGLTQLEREIEEMGDPDALAAAIAGLDGTIAQAEADFVSALERLTNARSDLDRMDGSAAAAEAAEAVEQECASITHHAQDYLRLRLAEQILLRCIEAYRQEHQAPVLRFAQQVFTGLTLDEYRELAADTDEKNEIVLQARQAGGSRVGVGQMSEGTLDQLYFALRLASLQHFADEGRAMPLVLDDVLMTFDDHRTRAGFRLLDEMADRFQIIVLTHHDHVAALARDVLPTNRIHVHDLQAAA
ncbi:MAG TPA: AAA family ATPase [Actinospica sp.]|jgi:uncharacterized protein YhaN|nr:AAA family ATPase [Actinospica sp.]